MKRFIKDVATVAFVVLVVYVATGGPLSIPWTLLLVAMTAFIMWCRRADASSTAYQRSRQSSGVGAVAWRIVSVVSAFLEVLPARLAKAGPAGLGTGSMMEQMDQHDVERLQEEYSARDRKTAEQADPT